MADKPLDVISLLKADHREVEEMFEKFEGSETSEEDKEEYVEAICEALTVHARLEEEIVYPAFREAGVDALTMDEAKIEHASFKQLVEDLEGASSDDEECEARMKVLSEYVKHHVKEEENEMFPKAQGTSADLEEIGRRAADRKRELMEESQVESAQ